MNSEYHKQQKYFPTPASIKHIVEIQQQGDHRKKIVSNKLTSGNNKKVISNDKRVNYSRSQNNHKLV